MTPDSVPSDPITILGSGTVVTRFGQPDVVLDGGVAFNEGTIIDVGPFAELISSHPGARLIDLSVDRRVDHSAYRGTAALRCCRSLPCWSC